MAAETSAGRSRVLIVSADRISRQMAGPAIRAWEMCRYLARRHDVRLVVRAEVQESTESLMDLEPDGFVIEPLWAHDVKRHVDWADVLVVQGSVTQVYPDLCRGSGVLVCDLYDPFHLEGLELARDHPHDFRVAFTRDQTEGLNEQGRIGDLFLCASEIQRHFWLGHLASLGRVNPVTYDDDPTLRSLIDIVPFGIQSEPPKPGRVMRGVLDGIGADDHVVLWGGGIYNWFDPLTVIEAVHRLRDRHPNIRLVFMGTKHPNPEVPEMRMSLRARELSAQLGLDGKHVFFNEGWVSYDQRGAWFLESDVGVSCHVDHVETSYSFRTRVLDYLWAGKPVVVTDGDAMSRIVEDNGLGLTVGPGDVAGWANALERTITDRRFIEDSIRNIEAFRDQMSWDTVLQPLGRVCDRPRRAPDLPVDRFSDPSSARTRRTAYLLGQARLHWRQGGIRQLRVHLLDYTRRTLRRS